jgi:type II secretory pathway pseudopilin PulG
MHNSLRKYQIGLAIIGVFTLVLIVIVLVQASATKQDTKTTRVANDIATKLEAYISDKQAIPSSLSAIDVSDVPTTISYQKLSSSSYKFCLTYKSASSGFDAASAVSEVASGSYGGSYSSLSDSSASSSDTSYLSIPDTHHKGQNCQTIKPYIFSDSSSTYNSPVTSSSALSLFGTYSGVQSKARDTERSTDLKTLQSQLEAYFAMNNSYPTLADLNDASWVSQNMKGMDIETLRDPQGNNAKLVSTPTKNAYSYEVTDQNGKDCTVDTGCTQYKITAEQETGDPLVYNSLN